MPEQVSIICPECGYRKDVPKTLIPEGSTRANCPKCRQSFALNSETLTDCPPPETGQPTPPPPPPHAPSHQSPPLPPADAKPRLLTFSFTGSANVSVGCTVTCRSRTPLSADTRRTKMGMSGVKTSDSYREPIQVFAAALE